MERSAVKEILHLEFPQNLPPFFSTLVSKAMMDRRWLDKIDSGMVLVIETT